MIALMIWQGQAVLSLFTSDADVIAIAYVRICVIFPASPTFATIMAAYPVSLGTTALLIAGALALFRPAAIAQSVR